MSYFKYWVFNRNNPHDETDCCYVQAADQDSATRLTEPPTGPYPPQVHLRVREIQESELPEGASWIG